MNEQRRFWVVLAISMVLMWVLEFGLGFGFAP